MIMNGKQNYLMGCRWNMEVGGAFGVTLRLSSLVDPFDCFDLVYPQLKRANPLNGHKLAQKPHRNEETLNLTEVTNF